VNIVKKFIDILEKRRSIYELTDKLPISKTAIENLVKGAVRLSPSAFNSQTSRVVFLWALEKEHFWTDVEEALRPLTSAKNFPTTQDKIAGFRRAAGVFLFFEDTDIVSALQENFPLYADNFPWYSEQSTGIAAVNSWSALAEVGIGANLQHYNPVVDEKVAKNWQIPSNWKLKGQLVVGGIAKDPSEKEFMNDNLRFKSFG